MKTKLTHAFKRALKIFMALALLSFSQAMAQPEQIIASNFTLLKTQPNRTITGEIIEQQSGEAVPFANLALIEAESSTLVSGGTTNMAGKFEIVCNSPGNYQLRISALGYETVYKDITLEKHTTFCLGTIYLVVEEIYLEGVVVAAERIKAISGIEKTTYMVNRNMLSASNTGTDLLKLVPGISVDIRQNISLEGSQQIKILVDGVERDRDFVAQIPAGQIDKIEVSTQPSARFDGSASGVINILLIREKNAGFEGQVYLEIPTSSNEVYLFPKYNLRYGSGKLNFFASYTGELTNLKVLDSYQRNLFDNNDITRINVSNHLQQQTWSHRFHYGMDYFVNERTQLNFYGYYNPFSFEYSGKSELFLNGSENASWSVDKKDQDLNHGFHNSLFFKHILSETGGHELTADLIIYSLKGENNNTFSNEEIGYYQQNRTLPSHLALNLKIDYCRPLTAIFNYEAGGYARHEKMVDRTTGDFAYGENTFALYNTIGYNGKKFTALAGVRLEKSELGQSDEPKHAFTALLPGASVNFQLNKGQNLSLSYRQSIKYPRFFQLNPSRTVTDPFSVHSGNPFLKPARLENIQLEHSIRFGNQYVSTRVFYGQSKEVISHLNWLNNEGILESWNFNLGNISQYGMQVTGAFSLGKKTGINPVLRMFEVKSAPNTFGLENGLTAYRKMAWSASVSAYTLLPGEITASLVFNYSSPLPELQVSRFSNALYFLSLEKDFGKGFRAGLISAIPFAGSFVYQGSETNSFAFSDYSTGEILMSMVPFWIKFNFQFFTGKKRESIDRQREETESIQRRGF
ncbi:MAG: TonB-dependent receptor [Bacteroides sp.]|jgi:hypothetical protein|nr:TonB-dependent receptor [Bacteroides sp.]